MNIVDFLFYIKEKIIKCFKHVKALLDLILQTCSVCSNSFVWFYEKF